MSIQFKFYLVIVKNSRQNSFTGLTTGSGREWSNKRTIERLSNMKAIGIYRLASTCGSKHKIKNSGQSYKASTSVNYDTRVVNISNWLLIMTRNLLAYNVYKIGLRSCTNAIKGPLRSSCHSCGFRKPDIHVRIQSSAVSIGSTNNYW